MIDRDAAAALMEPLTDLVIRAGAAILAVDRRAMRIDGKGDGSPVTEADLAADRIIGEGLARLVPAVPALSEERSHLAMPPYDGSFFLIDPLDGTKEFVAGRNEFTVNLALVSNGTPLLGIVGAPALGLIWRGVVGRGAERLTVVQRRRPRAEPIHTRRFPQRGDPGRRPSAARMATPGPKPSSPAARRGQAMLGSAVKFARVAEGAADIYPRLAPTCEWDVAAGHAVVTAAGGKITDSSGAAAALRLGREGFHRAGIHRLGRSRGGALTVRLRYCASSLLQPGPARAGLAQQALPGSAAKASRLSSRPNR